MGLSLLLDAHTNKVSGSSINRDFKGFLGLISNKGSFPFVQKNGFQIQPGFFKLKHPVSAKLRSTLFFFFFFCVGVAKALKK